MTSASPPLSAPPLRYATFTRRFRALIVDNVLVGAIWIALLLLSDALSGVPGSGRVAWVLTLAVILLYEPILVWRRGATVGHAMYRLRVIETRSGGFPSFGRALARYVVKLALGAPSFIAMAVTRKHQAVHDLLTRTTVQVPLEEDSVEFHVERVEEADRLPPSRRRRIAVILLYLVVTFIANAVVVSFVDPTSCARTQSCTGGTRIAVEALSLLWLGLSLAMIVLGWKGLLFGARRTQPTTAEPTVA